MIRRTARAIMLRGRQLLVIRRVRVIDGHRFEYLSIPGGKIEAGETAEQAVVRELHEELDILPMGAPRHVLDQTCPQQTLIGHDHPPRQHSYFAVDVPENYRPHLSTRSEESMRSTPGSEEYWPEWVDIDKLPVPLHPDYDGEVLRAMRLHAQQNA